MFRHLPSPIALRAFEAASRLGSFKAAAEELSVTPTAVSHQIRALEAQLGLTLFVRKTRAIETTPEGQQLATAIFEGYSHIRQALSDLVEAETTLTISTTPAFAALWLVPRAAAFQQIHPNIKLRFDTSTERVHLAKDKRIDMVIRYGDTVYEDWVRTPISEESFGVYGSPALLQTLHQTDQLNLLEVRWQQRHLQEFVWSQWLAAAPDCLPSTLNYLEYDQEHFAINAALAGQGLVLASSLLVQDFVSRGWLQPFQPGVTLSGMQYAAYCLPEKARQKSVQAFVKWLKLQT